MARIPARYRGLPQRQAVQVVSHGYEGRAKELYVNESLNTDIDATLYALDCTTIDLCLSLFDWAPFRATKAPLTIAALYKNRWQVELFFKWIKQHLRIKRFLGTSKNAVKM